MSGEEIEVKFRTYLTGGWFCENVTDPDGSIAARTLEDFAELLSLLFPAARHSQCVEARFRAKERVRLARLLEAKAAECQIDCAQRAATFFENSAEIIRNNLWRIDMEED